MWKNSWNCNAKGDKYSNLTFGGVVFTISKLWKNSSNCNARGDKYSNLTFRGMTIWRDFSQLSYSKSNPPKVKLLYLSPLALQFDEFFPMINGFLKYVGVLIEVYTMLICEAYRSILSLAPCVFFASDKERSRWCTVGHIIFKCV